MEENLVGYLLNALDDETQQQVEAYLRTDPQAQQRLELLRRALEPLAADADDPEPPPGLRHRTLIRVAEYRCRPHPEPPPVAEPIAGPPARLTRWRRIDLLVAAAIGILGFGLILQGAFNIRTTHARLACADNLRNFHQALMAFASQNQGELPGLPFQHRYTHPEDGWPLYNDPQLNVAGIFVPELGEFGCLEPQGQALSVRCPGNGPKVAPNQTLRDLKQLKDRSPDQFDQTIPRMAGCYAYSLGWMHPAGFHCPLYRDPSNPDLNDDLLPVMADCPAPGRGTDRDNSRNHRTGQNVLYLGGHVRFVTTPNAGIDGDHIYVNRDGKVAPGLDRWDAVLGSSGDRP